MTVCGTSAWQSPEVLDGKPYGEPVSMNGLKGADNSDTNSHRLTCTALGLCCGSWSHARIYTQVGLVGLVSLVSLVGLVD